MSAENNKYAAVLVDVLAGLGMALYFALQLVDVSVHFLPKTDSILKDLAFSAMMVTQILRGLLWHLDIKLKPSWLLLSKMDKRMAADTTVVFLLWWLFLEVALHSQPQLKEFSKLALTALSIIQLVFGAWLMVLSFKKISLNTGTSVIIILIGMAIFLAPLWLVADIGFSIYKFSHFNDQRDLECLITAAIVPLFASVLILSLNDQRDRAKNTLGVIKSQLFALPFYPLCFLGLRYFWPENVSLSYFQIALCLLLVPLFLCPRGKRAWLIKEKVEILQQSVSLKRAVTQVVPGQFDDELRQIHKELADKKLILKIDLDHLDRADALKKLAELEENLEKSSDAEQTYEECIKSYNRVLELNPSNQAAIGSKFKAVEAHSELRRRRADS